MISYLRAVAKVGGGVAEPEKAREGWPLLRLGKISQTFNEPVSNCVAFETRILIRILIRGF